ncbi:hypothetical protein CDAR_569401 [Caerostris darwini]|uniref:Uncharacterized protein n=1 Tax=Caerostris darwini TaxID=1538125 RepID=A0AAV4UDJ5_9ARAC|nr:hypothetical protein CDAR_569401 [Caerostris darwini]
MYMSDRSCDSLLNGRWQICEHLRLVRLISVLGADSVQRFEVAVGCRDPIIVRNRVMYVGDAMVETADLSKGYMVAAVTWCRRLAQSKSLGIILDGRTNHQKYEGQ